MWKKEVLVLSIRAGTLLCRASTTASPILHSVWASILLRTAPFSITWKSSKGAADLLTGAGEPGGTVNLVRKRPTETFQAQAEAEVGSWDRNGWSAIFPDSGPLTQSGILRGRLVAVADDSGSFVDHAYNDKKAFYGILELVPSADTRVGLGL